MFPAAVLEQMRSRLDAHLLEARDPYLGREFERNWRARDRAHPAGDPYP